MPYEVQVPELNVLEKIGEIFDKDGSHIAYEHRSVAYTQGEVVEDDVISPVVVGLYDEGDEHTRSVLKRVAKPKATGRGKAKAAAEEVEDPADSDEE
jgi:hypothetical protein